MKIYDTSALRPDTVMSKNDGLWIYNGLDCMLTYEVLNEVSTVMDAVTDRTYQLSRALQAPILAMNMRGVLIDVAARDEAIHSLEADKAQILNNFDYICNSVFGRTFSPGSPKQMLALFYDYMNLPPEKGRNAQGEWVPAVGREELENLAKKYYHAKPLVGHILRYRDITKQIGTLVTELSPSGRLHTSFSIAGTKTGRLASSAADFGDGTNLQNIDKRIRKTFIADPGMKFANIDLEQADARNLGAFTWHFFPEFGDTNRFLDYAESGDLHTNVCRMCWTELPWTGDPKKDREIADQKAYREKSFRDLAKALGHGTNFNGQPPQMAMHTKVERSLIEDFQRRYFGAFPEVKHRIEFLSRKLQEDGNLTTLFGRRRFFLKRRTDKRALNDACAFDPQSMTADEINYIMLAIFDLSLKYPIQLLLQVHDSLLIQYPEELEDEFVPLLKKAFEVPLILRGNRRFIVPAEVQVGWNWAGVEYDKVTKQPSKNLLGLIKYKGHDSRIRA